MELINPSKYFKKYKFIPSKKMGQNFLIDKEIISKIGSVIKNNKYDAIIEIGPGLGAVTKELYELGVDLHLIEVDKRLFEYLQMHYKDSSRVSLYCKDILKFDIDSIAAKYKKCIIVSNLPYSISSLIIIQFLKTKHIKTMFCMLQKELVDRMISEPCSSIYNSFSVLVQKYANIEKIMTISNSSFIPSPEVISNFIKIEKKQNIEFNEELNKFIKLIFSSKRKTLFNNLKFHYSKEKLNNLYKHMLLNRNIRAEELSYNVIEKIYEYINKQLCIKKSTEK